MADTEREKKKSFVQLISEIPTLVEELVRGEIELLKTEVIQKLKLAGIGAGLIAGAALIALFFIGVLLVAAILALSLIMPGWLAALLVAFVLLVAVAVLAWLGMREVKKAMPPVPEETIASLQQDYNAIKGIGKRKTI